MKNNLNFSLIFVSLFFFIIVNGQNAGILDNSFNIGTGFNNQVNAIVLQPDGKILVGGQFTSYNGEQKKHIVRLNTDGTIDYSFNIGTGFSGPVNSTVQVLTIIQQSDGKILVGGGFTSYNGQNHNKILRLNADGTIDTSFNSELFTFDYYLPYLRKIILQPDGKILVVGQFSTYNNEIQRRIVRLNSNGTLDSSFNSGTGFSYNVDATTSMSIVLQNDGKILVGGDFDSYNGQNSRRIVRLNTDGTRDTSFNIGSGFAGIVSFGGYVASIILQSDEKIIVGGSFLSYNGQTRRTLVRLNQNGTLDTSFSIPVDLIGAGIVTDLQPDGKIILGGNILQNGQAKNINRLDNNGSIDNSFTTGIGFNNAVYTLAIQNDGKILVGGLFTSYDGQTTNRIARLHGDNTLSIEDFNNESIKTYPNPVKDVLFLNKEVKKVTVTDLTGKVLAIHNSSNQIDMSTFQSGVYLIVMETENNLKVTRKIVKE
jgi:uncharacterized delta-60 repeat protein